MMPGTLAVTVLLAALPAAVDVDTIIPRPKEIRLVGDPVALTGFCIVAARQQQARIAAEEINERISAVGGRKLPVRGLARPLPKGRLIVISPCTTEGLEAKQSGLKVSPSDPGRQGYVIQPVGRGKQLRLYLVGSDALGTLYAAVTCRRLIAKRNGRAVLQPAVVRDWPDFKYRQHGMAFAEHVRGDWYGILAAERKGDAARARGLAGDYVALQKRYYDWMLRTKINVAWHPVNYKPGDMPAQTTAAAAALREIHEYGLARGIEAMAGDTTAIGAYPRDKDNPDFKDVVRHRSHNRYFCWSRPAYHRRRARRAAEWLEAAGYRGYYLHSTDGGGWQNPELWKDRCPLCRKTYGDDRAKADSVVYDIYYREIKKRIPDLKFVAVIYPYTGRYLDRDYVYEQAAAQMGSGRAARDLADRTVAGLTRFIRRLDELLPKDVFVCIRESDRRHFDLARAAWGKRRFQLYYEYAFWKGWRPLFITTGLWTKTFHEATRDDILFSPSNKPWSEPTLMLGAECSWNVNRPGSREFDTKRWLEIGTAVAPPPQRRAFAGRACRRLFGETAGPLIAPLFAENISYMFITQPDEVMRRTRIDDPVATMLGQARAAGRAAESLEKLRQLQAKAPVLAGDRYGYFLNLYQPAQAAPILATHRAHVLAAKAAIGRGDRKATAGHLAAAREHLARAAPAWQAAQRNVPADKLFRAYVRKASVQGMLHHLDIQALQKEVDDLWSRRESLIAAHTIPRWYERTCRRREVLAVPAGGEIRPDGILDEEAWKRARPIERFVDYRVLRIEGLETQARLLYDANHLYVAFECRDPDPAGIGPTMPDRDEWSLCDSVEVLVAPRAGREFVHWIVDARGTVFDARTAAVPNGQSGYSRKWDGTARVGAAAGGDRWTVEMCIPKADLGIGPKAGRSCRALLCRNIVHTRPKGEAEQNAIVFLDGNSFHTVEKFAVLRFAERAERRPAPRLGLTLQPMSMRHVTTGDGAGTRVEGELRFGTDTYLHDVRVVASFTDGVEPLGRKQLGRVDLVRLLWRPEKPFFHLFGKELPGVVCTFGITAREGRWAFVRRYGSPRRDPAAGEGLYAAGVGGRDRSALAKPAFLSAGEPRAIRLSEGTIEFWVRPNWDVIPRGPGPDGALAHAFFNMGPIRPDHPYLSNHSSATIAHHRSGNLVCTLSNRNYESRTVQAGIRNWRKGQWHHVALQWKLDEGGKTAMALFLDGKLASDRCQAGGKGRNDRPLKMSLPPLPIQVGSMNTGYAPGQAAIDELRISSVRRYEKGFTPARHPKADDRALVLFHFDGTLKADAPKGAEATPGPAQ